MKIGVYVGIFNPPHKDHINLVKTLIKEKYLDKVEIVATQGYGNKINITYLEQRIAMLELLQTKNIIINKEFNKLTYTYEIMRAFKKKYIYDQIYLIIGADNIIDFSKWHNFPELLTYPILVINRNKIDINSYINNISFKHNIKIVSYKGKDISSTQIREMFKNNQLTNINDFLDKLVVKYILENKLYAS